MVEAPTQNAAPEQLTTLPRRLESHPGFADVLAAMHDKRPVTIDGAWGSSCALLAATLSLHCPGPLIVVCPQQRESDDFLDDLELFSSTPCQRFPAWEADPGERILHDDIYADRLRTLKQLAESRASFESSSGPQQSARAIADPQCDSSVARRPIIVTSIQSLLQATPRPEAVQANSRILKTGDEIDVEALLRWLVEHGFHSTTAIELPGEFCSRGGIIDIFAPDWYGPVRIELFGDEIESIRVFDVATQRSLESLDSVQLTVLKPSDDDRDHLASFLPADAWFLLIEPEQINEQGKHFLRHQEQTERCHSVPGVLGEINRFAVATAAAMAQGAFEANVRLQIESVERFSGDVSKVRQELEAVARHGELVRSDLETSEPSSEQVRHYEPVHAHEVFIICQTDGEVKRLEEIFRDTSLFQSGKLHFPLGRLREGFRLVVEGIVLVSGAEMFHRADVRRPARRRLGKAIDSFMDLREGDLVVHLAHGIGRYRGMKLLERDDQTEEHLQIEFHGGTKIYVPATKIDLVQKYVGGKRARPTLAKIGGKSWLKQKQAAEKAVNDVAAEMLEMQAERLARPGISFPSDSDWQREFDSLFPYHETPDQLAAIAAIKSDMEKARPMDRLLCGDVGFGKTEMAIRAAFKAVDNGYQVAVLVPTTILAEQHFRTFSQRMAEFPCEVARLSRFCSGAESRRIVEGLRQGHIDVVIGTHRLVSSDVGFENLGLIVIDEEQRFGVDVKERLKAFRSTVDVLTMTATPIPRTLHLSMVGVRDISNLETPPEERLAVETKVARREDELVRHAIHRELSRGGQVFFVHNRVHDIEIVYRWLKNVVPDASVRIGHGQMPEHELEQVMVDFIAGKFDVLLATTIVESGLDIPNANTIFIDDANRYGLADLHQLRGRVGRYKHRAYCYLLLNPHRHISPNAARRLRAIEEFSEMGAGFALSMRDLEIRGAGNILGSQQSGHIAAVGYEFYCALMEKTVRRLKKLPPKISIDVTIDLPGQAYFPRDYIDDMRTKIDLYRRLTRIAGEKDLHEFHAELTDRFGPPPPPVVRLLSLAQLRMDAAVWQIHTIHMEDRFVVFSYANRERIDHLARLNGRRLRVVDGEQAYLTLRRGPVDPNALLSAVKSVLQAS